MSPKFKLPLKKFPSRADKALKKEFRARATSAGGGWGAFFWGQRILVPVMCVLLLFVGGNFGLNYVDHSPTVTKGHALYGIKRNREVTALKQMKSPTQRSQHFLVLSGKRLSEATYLWQKAQENSTTLSLIPTVQAANGHTPVTSLVQESIYYTDRSLSEIQKVKTPEHAQKLQEKHTRHSNFQQQIIKHIVDEADPDTKATLSLITQKPTTPAPDTEANEKPPLSTLPPLEIEEVNIEFDPAEDEEIEVYEAFAELDQIWEEEKQFILNELREDLEELDQDTQNAIETNLQILETSEDWNAFDTAFESVYEQLEEVDEELAEILEEEFEILEEDLEEMEEELEEELEAELDQLENKIEALEETYEEDEELEEIENLSEEEIQALEDLEDRIEDVIDDLEEELEYLEEQLEEPNDINQQALEQMEALEEEIEILEADLEEIEEESIYEDENIDEFIPEEYFEEDSEEWEEEPYKEEIPEEDLEEEYPEEEWEEEYPEDEWEEDIPEEELEDWTEEDFEEELEDWEE